MKETEIVLSVNDQNIVAIAGSLNDAEPKITRHALWPHPQGFRSGCVSSLEQAADTLERIVFDLFRDMGKEFEKSRPNLSVSVALSNSKIKTFTFSSSIYFKGAGRRITHADIQSVVSQTRSVATLPLTEAILQTVPVSFTVNDLEGVLNPVGMEAQRLGVTLKLFTMDFDAFRNLSRAFELADIDVEGFFPKPLTSSQALLTEAEKKERALLVDISYGATFLTYWKRGELVHTRVVPEGVGFLAERIGKHWNVAEEDAAQALQLYGSLGPDQDFGEELVPLVSRSGNNMRTIARREFQLIVFKYAESWLERLLQHTAEFEAEQQMQHPAYVFSGKATEMDGFMEWIQPRIQGACRVGRSSRFEVPSELALNTDFTDCLGLFHWLAYDDKTRRELLEPKGILEGAFGFARSLFLAYF